MFWLASNTLGIYGLDKFLDSIAEHTDKHEGLALSLGYASWIAAQFFVNKEVIIPIARRIKRKYERRRRTDKRVTLLDRLRVAGATASLVGILSMPSFQRSFNALEYDIKRGFNIVQTEVLHQEPKKNEKSLESLLPLETASYESDAYTGFLTRLLQYEDTIRKNASLNNIDKTLVKAVIYRESEGYTKKISPQGALGLMQILPKTAKTEFKISLRQAEQELRNPKRNIEYGTQYLSLLENYAADLVRSQKGNTKDETNTTKLVLASYNGGYGRLECLAKEYGPNWENIEKNASGIFNETCPYKDLRGKQKLPKETRNYVRSVLKAYAELNVREGSFPLLALYDATTQPIDQAVPIAFYSAQSDNKY